MIDISKLYCGTVQPSDALRHGDHSGKFPSSLLPFSTDKQPVVVWNVTRRCNLKCAHCYVRAEDHSGDFELTTKEGRELINDLAGYGVPALLFCGGEPLVRPDLPELAAYAVEKGIHAVIATNGTLVTSEKARILKDVGLSYAGISLDGMEEANDRLRGVRGAFAAALDGIRNFQASGIEAGLRFTIGKHNIGEIPGIFNLIEEMDIPRICFYHPPCEGLDKEKPAHEEVRRAIDLIVERTRDLYKRGIQKEVLTADNHADGPYLYLKLLKENPERAEDFLEFLKIKGENNSGREIGYISWDGSVYEDQFRRHNSFGSIRKRPFSKIWSDASDLMLKKPKERKDHIKGRCLSCNWIDVCAGYFGMDSEAPEGVAWKPDSDCYLTDEEISETV